jgi:hypothetical protein
MLSIVVVLRYRENNCVDGPEREGDMMERDVLECRSTGISREVRRSKEETSRHDLTQPATVANVLLSGICLKCLHLHRVPDPVLRNTNPCRGTALLCF